MQFTSALLKKARSVKSAEELLALAQENGMELTEEEVEGYFAALHYEGKVSEDELENVVGGCSDPTIYGTNGTWAPICSGHFKRRPDDFSTSVRCGDCIYFQGEYNGYGACLREVM